MKLLYFASVRQKIGIPGEEITLPAGIVDAAGLLNWLKGRGGAYAEALADRTHVRIAINQNHADAGMSVTDDDEVAFFPPVTGG